MCTLAHGSLCRHCHHVNFAVLIGNQHDHALSQFLFQLVTKFAQTVHINTCNPGSKQFHTFYFLHLIHNVAQSVLRRLAL